MHSDDSYRAQLQTAIASLRYWVPSVSDMVRVEDSESTEYWKMAVTPKTPGACPFELVFRSDKHFDLVIAGETYEDLELADFGLFLPLVEAIASGGVVQRRRRSQATGALCEIETLVKLPDGKVWSPGRRTLAAAAGDEAQSLELHDRHFLPYRR